MALKVKRVYEPPSPEDGVRVLVDHLWPRGLREEQARVDWWAKELAPSHALRRFFAHDPQRYREFLQRYREELKGNPALERLKALSREKTVEERRQEKLLALLERLAQVERALLTREAFHLGLTALQAQLLLHLSERPHGVVALAELLSLTPATVSEALSSLEGKGLLTRSKDERDGRRWALKPTAEGIELAHALKTYAGPLRQALAHIPHQEEVLSGLMELLAKLVRQGTVPETGLCLTCRYLRREEGFFCSLFRLALTPWDLRLACPDRAPA